MGNILVLNGMSYASAITGLGEINYSKKSFLCHPKDFSLVLFTGGADVSPRLYGDTSPDGYCHSDATRDLEEMEVFEVAKKHEILMAGICRGVQFLNVMDGGSMMHHVENHTGGPHRMMTVAGEISVNTLHHQMVIPSENGIIIGSTFPRRSSIYIGPEDKRVDWQQPENEAVLFPKIRALGVQYHPEVMAKDSEGYGFFYNMVQFALENSFEEVIRVYTKGDANFDYFTVRNGNVRAAR